MRKGRRRENEGERDVESRLTTKKQIDVYMKSGIYEFWFIAFLRLTRLPANDFILPTAVVDRSPKFFN